MKAKLTFLGTGTSGGIPEIGCECPVCLSDEQKNKRLRTSVLLEQADFKLLIDTTPDLRQQALAYHIRSLDAVLYTHDHYDHLAGLDEIRRFNYYSRQAIPVYGNPYFIRRLRRKYDYCFRPFQLGGGIPKIIPRPVKKDFAVGPFFVQPVKIFHGRLPILGYRIGSLAYITDASRIPEKSMNLLKGLDVLVLNALRYEKHSTHFNLEESLEVISKCAPQCAYLIHMTHDIDHHTVNNKLPEHVHLAYDGLNIDLNLSSNRRE